MKKIQQQGKDNKLTDQCLFTNSHNAEQKQYHITSHPSFFFSDYTSSPSSWNESSSSMRNQKVQSRLRSSSTSCLPQYFSICPWNSSDVRWLLRKSCTSQKQSLFEQLSSMSSINPYFSWLLSSQVSLLQNSLRGSSRKARSILPAFSLQVVIFLATYSILRSNSRSSLLISQRLTAMSSILLISGVVRGSRKLPRRALTTWKRSAFSS